MKIGWIGLGLHVESHADDQWIITSHVRAIAVELSATGATLLADLAQRALWRRESLGPEIETDSDTP